MFVSVDGMFVQRLEDLNYLGAEWVHRSKNKSENLGIVHLGHPDTVLSLHLFIRDSRQSTALVMHPQVAFVTVDRWVIITDCT